MKNNYVWRLIGGSKSSWLLAVITLSAVIALYVLSYIVSANRSQNALSNTHAITGEPSDTIQEPGESHKTLTNVSTGGRIDESKTVAYQGVSFNYSTSLASEIKAETNPAYVLQSETDTGQGVVPEHIIFKFSGTNPSVRESFFSPKIVIYPIADYKNALSKSKSYVKQFEDEIKALKVMLSEQPKHWEKAITFLPFEIGASQRFHARIKYVNFQNGRGVLFLTQYNVEPALINNQGLTYTFQGLTDDNTYYVSATFPVTAPFLPESYDAESAEGYELIPPKSYRRHEYDAFENTYKVYLAEVIKKLEHLSPDSYQPNLIILEDLIRSLKVKKN